MRRPALCVAAATLLMLGACSGDPEVSDVPEEAEAIIGDGPPAVPIAADRPCGAVGRADANGDRRLELAEYRELASAAARWDLNEDKRIARAEFESCGDRAGLGGNLFNVLDEDKNEYLEETEFFGEQHFQHWDVNRDGALTSSELSG